MPIQIIPSLSNDLSHYAVLLRMVNQVVRSESVVEEIELALGSGFYYLHEDHYYLITNGHNVTGVNPETQTRLSAHAAFPTHLTRQQRFRGQTVMPEAIRRAVDSEGINPDHVLMMHPTATKTTFALYHDNDSTQPDWYIHPVHGYKVDVVALPLGHKDSFPPHIEYNAINKSPLLTEEPWIADDVFILGYPFGVTNELELPIWKKGSIASEPNMDYKELPKMLIDTASRSGMSGAPVILRRSGIHGLVGGKMVETSSIGTVFGFVGIYSGRIGAQDELSAQLGIVWRKQVIEEILAAKVVGTIAFQLI